MLVSIALTDGTWSFLQLLSHLVKNKVSPSVTQLRSQYISHHQPPPPPQTGERWQLPSTLHLSYPRRHSKTQPAVSNGLSCSQKLRSDGISHYATESISQITEQVRQVSRTFSRVTWHVKSSSQLWLLDCSSAYTYCVTNISNQVISQVGRQTQRSLNQL